MLMQGRLRTDSPSHSMVVAALVAVIRNYLTCNGPGC